MRALATLVMPVLVALPRIAAAAPAFEWDGGYFQTNRPISGRSFRAPGAQGAPKAYIDGGERGVDRAVFHGGEIAFFGRGDVLAIGPRAAVAFAAAPDGAGLDRDLVHVRTALEVRATLSRDRFTGWFGLAAGMSVVTLPPMANQAGCARCSWQATRIEPLVEPRIGLEYALWQGEVGRTAIGGWIGAEPFVGAWSGGIAISARVNLTRATIGSIGPPPQ
jgi:hypothetical protein